MKFNKETFKRIKIPLIIILCLIIISTSLVDLLKPEPEEILYPDFLTMVDEGKVEEAEFDFLYGTKINFTDTDGNKYITESPRTREFKQELLMKGLKVKDVDSSTSKSLVLSFFFEILTLGMFLFLIYKFTFPKHSSEVDEANIPDITFDDIAGSNEQKKDLNFIIEFLKNPKKYEEIGAKIPKGILLVGPPGTGKTMFAKAIAGTAKVPFLSVSGSDFVELYVGLGSKRVRSLFKEAREKAPCIIFIDEIDAVGSHRGKSGNSEQDQTINALLNELDGFKKSENIIVIAATNRVEDLDSALIRPGRFDKHITVPLPEKEDRKGIIKIHLKDKKVSKDVNVDDIVSMTVGFSGAALASLLNEAAFIAVNEGKKEIEMEHINKAHYRMVMKGDVKENQSDRDKKELEIVAWHEAGHAFAIKKFTTDNVPKVTIASSTSGAGGVTFKNPKEMSLYSKKYLQGEIKSMYAGRIAEKLLLGSEDEITSGAREDIRQATILLREYISTYGMSDEFGLINIHELVGDFHNEILLKEAKELSSTWYKEVEKYLIENKKTIQKIAEKLLEKESINEDELDAIIDNKENLEC